MPFNAGEGEIMSDVTYTDILYEEKDGVATVTINRPDKLNAFRRLGYAGA
jgi:1,4-dihydroxy-2-naphthoyl-CoA synthase